MRTLATVVRDRGPLNKHNMKVGIKDNEKIIMWV